MRSMSCGCRPIVGSSNTYVTSVNADPRCRIIFTRCASPPDSVPAGRFSDRYPSPISTNESSVCASLSTNGATDLSFNERIQSARSVICMSHRSAIDTPLIFDDRAAAVSLVPSHSGHVPNVAARSTNARMCGWSASRSLDSMDFCSFGIRPS